MKYLSITADTLIMWIHIIENSISKCLNAMFVHYNFRTAFIFIFIQINWNICITYYVSKTLKTKQRVHIHTLKLKQFEWLPCTSKWWAEVHLVQIPLIREMIHCNSPCHMLAYTLNRMMILHLLFPLSFNQYYDIIYTLEIIHITMSIFLPETSSPAKRNLPHIQFRLSWVTHERITIEWPIIFLRFPWMKTTKTFYQYLILFIYTCFTVVLKSWNLPYLLCRLHYYQHQLFL